MDPLIRFYWYFVVGLFFVNLLGGGFLIFEVLRGKKRLYWWDAGALGAMLILSVVTVLAWLGYFDTIKYMWVYLLFTHGLTLQILRILFDCHKHALAKKEGYLL